MFLKKKQTLLNYLTIEEYKKSKEVMYSNLCIDHSINSIFSLHGNSIHMKCFNPCMHENEDTVRYNILKLIFNSTLKTPCSVNLDRSTL